MTFDIYLDKNAPAINKTSTKGSLPTSPEVGRTSWYSSEVAGELV